MTIWKYVIYPDTTYLDIPSGAEFLTLQVQNETPCLWFRVNPNNETNKIELTIVGTGWNLESGGYYVGTFQLVKDNLVFHDFSKELL